MIHRRGIIVRCDVINGSVLINIRFRLASDCKAFVDIVFLTGHGIATFDNYRSEHGFAVGRAQTVRGNEH